MSVVGVVLEVDVNGEELFFVDKVRCAAACGSLSCPMFMFFACSSAMD